MSTRLALDTSPNISLRGITVSAIHHKVYLEYEPNLIFVKSNIYIKDLRSSQQMDVAFRTVVQLLCYASVHNILAGVCNAEIIR